MKLKKLFWNWTNAIKTFPISHILLLFWTILWIWEVEWFIDLDSGEIVFATILSFILSCYGPLFLIHSNLKKKNTLNRIFQIWSIIIWGIYYILLCNINFNNITYSEWLLYIWIIPLALLWILVIVSLFDKQEEKIRFSWSSLFVSIIFGFIAWSIVRWWISGALASIEALFDIYIDWDLYADIGLISEILLAGSFVFNYYLTLTEDINEKSGFKIQPSRLRKIFWSFIFLPLALIYLAIFGAYGIKILITWVRPKWIIVRLGIWYFSLWVISSYLIYPDKTNIHEIINKVLFISFILIAFMMICAIVKRINQYWITINRCFVCYIITFIIIFSALSLIFPNKRLLSFISTLSILWFLAIYWRIINVNHISFNSQVNRLETLLSKENISLPLNEWDLKDMDKESSNLIVWALDWLVENYNKDKIINKIINFEYEDSYWHSRSKIREFLGVNSDYDNYYPTYKYRDFRQYGRTQQSIDVTWYSKILYFTKSYGSFDDFTLDLQIDNQKYKVDLSNYIEQLKEKADIYAKSDLTDEEKSILEKPALELIEQDYKIIINCFGLEETREWETQFTNIEWFILVG